MHHACKFYLPSRENPFYLLVALDNSLTASGLLFLDDGESIDSIDSGQYSLISYTVNNVLHSVDNVIP